MDFPNIKDLKKLANACRKAGISNFKYMKDGSFEFSLDPTSQPEVVKSSKKQTQVATSTNNPFESDTLTDDSLLFWSSPDPTPEASQ